MTVLLSFAAGFGMATLLFVPWLRTVRSDRDFWHRLYRSADESRSELVGIAVESAIAMREAQS